MSLSRHLVESTTFDFCFDSQDSAFKEQEQIASLVKKSLVPVMQEVFDEVSPDERVFRMESLDLDLGEADIKTYRSDLPELLRKKLLFALRQKGIRRQTENADDTRAGGDAQRSEDLKTLLHFLSRGSLPWHASRNGARNLARLLDGVLDTQVGGLADALRSDTRGVLINRLADQFSHEMCEKLLRTVASQTKANLVHRQSYADGQDETLPLEKEGRDFQNNFTNSWKRRLFEALDIPRNRLAENARDVEQSRLRRLVSRAILTGRPIIEKKLWAELVKTRSPILTSALLRHGARADVRKKLAEGFAEPALKDIVTVLEPVEAGFIEEVVSSPQMFTRAALNIPPERTRRRLFEYTLGYLIVDRGSRFNKKTYLESVVRKMAARENERLDDMLRSLVDILTEVKIQSPAAREMRIFLSEMSDGMRRETSRPATAVELSAEATPSASIQTPTPDLDPRIRENRPALLASLLKRALEKGDIAALLPVWQELTSSYRDLLKGIIIQYGRRPDVTANLAQGITFEMLFDLTRIITPAHAPLVEKSCARLNQIRFLRVFKTSSQKQAEAELRQIVLTCLLDEAAAGFDRRGYLFRLVKQIASRDNRAYTDVLDALIQDLGNIEARGHELDKIFSILKTLRETAGPGSSASRKGKRNAQGGHADNMGGHADNMGGHADNMGGHADNMGGHADNIGGHADNIGGHADNIGGHADNMGGHADNIGGHADNIGGHADNIGGHADNMGGHADNMGGHIGPPLHDYGGDGEHIDPVVRDMNLEDVEIERELEQLYADLPRLSASERDRLEFILRGITKKTSSHLCAALATQIQKKGARALAAQMPEELNIRILRMLEPDETRRAMPYTNLLVLAAKQAFLNFSLKEIKQTAQEALFRFLIVEGRCFSGAVFARFFLERLNRKLPTNALPVTEARLGSCLAELKDGDESLKAAAAKDLMQPMPKDKTRIKSSLRKSASDEPYAGSLRDAEPPSRPKDISRPKQKSRPWTVFRSEEASEPEPEETLFVYNAGLALVAPFLPRLFMMLNLTEAEAFKDFECRQRAVHVAQFIVDERADAPEYDLYFNKLLCGMTAAESVPKKIDVTDTEKQTVTSMLKGVIQHWRILKNTSVQGLRESFLQREGRLCISADEIRLLAASRPFDILLDALPWSFNIIKLPWMKRPIYVDWR